MKQLGTVDMVFGWVLIIGNYLGRLMVKKL
jgi:hypothetical protein